MPGSYLEPIVSVNSERMTRPAPSASGVLKSMGELVFGVDDPRDLVPATLELLSRLFCPRVVCFGLCSPETGDLILQSQGEGVVEAECVLPAGGSVAGAVAASSRARAVFDPATEIEGAQLAADPSYRGGAVLIAPLRSEGLTLGVLQVCWSQTDPCPPVESLALLESIGEVVGRALLGLHRRQASQTAPTAQVGDSSRQPPACGLEAPGFVPCLDALRLGLGGRGLLIRGEPGSGKEVFARAAAARRGEELSILRCYGKSESELELTLFGRGGEAGCLETLGGGLLYIDELSCLPRSLQEALSELVSQGELRRSESKEAIDCTTRLVFSTRRDLGVIDPALLGELPEVVEIPPLRRNPSDIVGIAQEMLGTFRVEMARGPSSIAPGAQEELLRHGWPGNLRELHAVLEIACSFASGEALDSADLAVGWGVIKSGELPEIDEALPLSEAVAVFKRGRIERAMARCGGNQTRAAESLGVRQPNLSRLMATLGMRSRRG